MRRLREKIVDGWAMFRRDARLGKRTHSVRTKEEVVAFRDMLHAAGLEPLHMSWLAQACFRVGCPEVYIETAETMLSQENKADKLYLYDLAFAYAYVEQFNRALACMNEYSLSKKGDGRLYLGFAEINVMKGDYLEALRYCDRVSDPKLVKYVQLCRGEALYRLDRYSEAIEALLPVSRKLIKGKTALYFLLPALIHEKRWDEALLTARRAVRRYHRNHYFWQLLACIHYQMNNHELAHLAAKKAVILNPSDDASRRILEATQDHENQT